jgi:hypothetical protein
MANTMDRANGDRATASEAASEAFGASQIGPFDYCNWAVLHT